ncbi:XrtA/PEP-CTERM system-associated ATPase [Rhizorhapis suberifaciens]|uniref:Putative secretion ATPase (PEP-CTERM system associated) n=1 Tax=Rhizorhapis suberifaciens TaxID=13656 RepID=A0A840HV01_9SPHN|nr:XrtA/PEP-CTERM system-associated ATPase [Rhizorhapis suberifaciens]MBB4642112.1 putative secretion ATPase (PEP-CTERM system associated) [Rhizorhapis suberifaciens]
MYDQFYGLTGRPFQLTPDPHFYYESVTHRKAMSYLGYGLAQGEGFIVITGDIGAGKTTLVGHLMATIDPSRLTAVKIVSTQVGGDDMLRLAAQAFGVAAEGADKAMLLGRIETWLHEQARSGRRSLLIVDEAQNLPISALEELRMLSNFQLGGQALLQIFLLGQPEFRETLRTSPALEQLRQRVIATHHLDPMMPNEVEPYILHRLSLVGWNGNPQFTADAFARVYQETDGIPRRINALASRVLLLGAIDKLGMIDGGVVNAVIADMAQDDEPVAPMAVVAEPVPEPQPAEEIEQVWTAPSPPLEQPAPRQAASLKAEVEQLREAVEGPRTGRASTVSDSRVDQALQRISNLESRLEEQEKAIRQMLALLVDWVERDEKDVAYLRGSRAA